MRKKIAHSLRIAIEATRLSKWLPKKPWLMFLSDTYAKNDCVLTEKYISMFPRSIKRISKVHRIIFATWKFGTQEFQQHRFAGILGFSLLVWSSRIFPKCRKSRTGRVCLPFPPFKSTFSLLVALVKSRSVGPCCCFPGLKTYRFFLQPWGALWQRSTGSQWESTMAEKSYLIRMSLCHGQDLEITTLKYSK